jgi:Zn-dependent protease with chaperone function
MREDRVYFPGLSSSHFTHPADEAALKAVKALPLVNTVIRKIFQYGFEKSDRVTTMSSCIKVGAKSFASINDMARDVCDRLDVPPVDLFIRQHPVVNAETRGAQYPFIVINTGLTELLTDDELYVVVAHEIGHIKCGHVLVHEVGVLLGLLAEGVGTVTLGLGEVALSPMQLALLAWQRQSELTADRAALLATQEAAPVLRALMKLAGGSTRFKEELDLEQFLRQGEMVESMTAGVTLNRLYLLESKLWLDHPLEVIRAAVLNGWSRSDDYRALVEGNYSAVPRRPTERPICCPHCVATLTEEQNECSRCGNALIPAGGMHRSEIDSFVAETVAQTASTISESVGKAKSAVANALGDALDRA